MDDPGDNALNRTIALSVGAGALVLILLFGSAIYAGVTTSRYYWETVNRCTDSGGMWIANNPGGVCVRR